MFVDLRLMLALIKIYNLPYPRFLMSNAMIDELIEKAKENLHYFFDQLDVAMVAKVLEILENCRGLLIFSGVGKSELVAKKIAFTMTSTGTPALFLSPTNALHGDIGIVTQNDVFVMLSKSGESDELLSLIPCLRNKGVPIVGLLSNPASRLAKACDHCINIPVQSELCPFGLAPTTSAVAQMLVGDILSVALMRDKNFTLDDYAKNHPSGRIGRRITLKVKDLMLTGTSIPMCRPQDKLIETLVELSNKKCGCVLIASQEDKLEGIFTDGDLRRALEKYSSQALDKSMADIMTKLPRSIGPDSLAWEAIKMMEADQKRPITVLAVVDQAQRVVGIIRMHDIIQSGL